VAWRRRIRHGENKRQKIITSEKYQQWREAKLAAEMKICENNQHDAISDGMAAAAAWRGRYGEIEMSNASETSR